MLRAVTKARCPGCSGPVDSSAANRWQPFCSERCRLADLGQWFAGRYAVPADDATPAEPARDPQSRQ
ncbi:MAG: DNA gyrase inhibitor YacG [Gammaproteobacteria bacterium]